MKKFVAITIIFVLCFSFSSCTADNSSYVNELISNSWSAHLDGGADVKLSFDGDRAELYIKSSDKSTKIEGRYIADEESFVIFMPKLAQNYVFEYIPSGEKLQLKYKEMAIEMSAD